MKLDLPYLSEERDRHGNIRLYVRKAGLGRIRLRTPPTAPDFVAKYEEALRTLEARAKTKTTSEVSTLGWLAREYEHGYTFQQKTPRDQRTIHLIFKSVLDDETKPGSKAYFRDMPLKFVTPEIIRKLRDRKQKTPSAANHRLKALRAMFTWGMTERAEHVKANPAKEVPAFEIKSEGYHTWTEKEVKQFEQRFPVGTMARLALDLLQYTAVRRSDVVLLGPKHLTEVANEDTGATETWLVFKPFKTQRTTGKQVSMPLLPVLRESLAAAAHGIETFLVTSFGKPFSVAGWGNWFRDRCDEAGLPHCTAHGVRKLDAVRAAEAGATEKQMMALFGWSTAQLAAFYARQANDKKLAAASVHTFVGKKNKG